MHPYDRFFFDPALGNGTGGAGYTVDKWLGDLNKRCEHPGPSLRS